MKNKFILTLIFIFNPKWWILNYSFDKSWDKELNELLDKQFKLKNGDSEHLVPPFRYTAILGNRKIWIANFPFAYGLTYESGIMPGRPSRYTIYRLRYKQKIDTLAIPELRNYKINKILS
jgi:hypothetical protein